MMQKLIIMLLAIVMIFSISAEAGDYVIGEGDGLDIAVWGVRDLNVSVRVRPDGKITIPGLGEVKASGFTPKALQEDLSVKLRELVKNPIVTVTVREITNSRVYIFGGGVSSGVYDLNRRTTLLQLLCMIGGTTSSSASGGGALSAAASSGGGPATSASSPDFKKAYVLRNGKKIREDFSRLIIDGDTTEDLVIESNDSVFIPPKLDRNIYVLGAVTTPRSIEFREGITVMAAILEAGGFTRFARENGTLIYRRVNGKETTIEVRAKDLVKDGDLSQNVRLAPGDYVIVKESLF